GMKDGKIFDYVSRTTPTSGRELNYLTNFFQLFEFKLSWRRRRPIQSAPSTIATRMRRAARPLYPLRHPEYEAVPALHAYASAALRDDDGGVADRLVAGEKGGG